MSGPPVYVYVVDDERPLRDGVLQLFHEAGYQAQAFASGKELLAAHTQLAPGCIVVDMFMPEMSGLELRKRLVAADCHWPIILLTGHGSRSVLDQAMEAGVIAFLEKPVRDVELLGAVMRGQALLTGKAEIIPDPELVRRVSHLTPRERQVLGYVVQNKLNKQIGAFLGIGETTVKGYRRALTKKLGVRNNTELLMLALRSGLKP
jgi:two-component system, LuxR family, response regulator FixJ